MRLCALCFSRPLAAPSGFALRAQATRPLRGGRISPLREVKHITDNPVNPVNPV